jgi:hypothetical protein
VKNVTGIDGEIRRAGDNHQVRRAAFEKAFQRPAHLWPKGNAPLDNIRYNDYR